MKSLDCFVGSKRWCAAALLGASVFVAEPAAAASGVMHVFSMVMSEDHYGTIVMSGDGYLDCAGHAIYNSNQPAVCWDDDAGTFQCGVMIEPSFDEWIIDIKNCRIENFVHGITVSYSGADVWIYNNQLFNNDDGLHTTASYEFNNFGNDISWNDDVGVRFFQGGMNLRTTWVWWNGVDGIDGDQFWGALIQSNHMQENGDHAIEFDDGQYANVYGNYIDGFEAGGEAIEMARDGIQLERIDHFNVDGNTVRDAGRYGIYLRDSLHGTVTNNNVAGSGRISAGSPDCYRRNGSSMTFSGNSFGTQTGCSTVP